MVHDQRLRHASLAAPSSRNVLARWLAAALFAGTVLLAVPAAQAQEAPPAPVVTVAKPLVRALMSGLTLRLAEANPVSGSLRFELPEGTYGGAPRPRPDQRRDRVRTTSRRGRPANIRHDSRRR